MRAHTGPGGEAISKVLSTSLSLWDWTGLEVSPEGRRELGFATVLLQGFLEVCVRGEELNSGSWLEAACRAQAMAAPDMAREGAEGWALEEPENKDSSRVWSIHDVP